MSDMQELEEKIHKAWQTRSENFPAEIEFDFPSKTAVVSLTGSRCSLNCAHCGGHYLRSMMPVWKADVAQATSCLISGGCDSQGMVPVLPHLETVKSLMRERRVNWHVGLISDKLIYLGCMRPHGPYRNQLDCLVNERPVGTVYNYYPRPLTREEANRALLEM